MSKWLVLPIVVLAHIATSATAAALRDRDHDRLPDRWERKHHLSTAIASAKRDPDGDHLNNRRELRLRTHPRRPDTDRDRLRDGAEIRRFHTNPRKPDSDGDGFRDRCELRKGTNPRKRRSRPKRRCSKSPQAPPPVPATPPPAPLGDSPKPTGGWPDASNTGVAAGTTLTPSASLNITEAGTVIDSYAISGEVTVNAPNVTIRNSRIGGNAFMPIRSNSTGLVVEDSEIVNQSSAGQNKCHNGIGFGGYTIRRSEISGCENGADVGNGNVLFEDNFVHDLDTVGPSYVWGNSPHTDGIQGTGSNVTVRHNTIDPVPTGSGVTAGIIAAATGSISDYRIEDNYIDGRGGSYAIYAPRIQTTGVAINRNRLLRGYGYTACVKVGITVAEFDDNRDAISDVLIPPDNGGSVFGSGSGGCTN